MILEIVQLGDPVLRAKCESVSGVGEEHHAFAQELIETMIDASGVGLAAPQVGRDIQMAVVDVSFDPECISFLKVNGEDAELASIMPLVFINPTLELLGKKVPDKEGCLSIDGVQGVVKRPEFVKATLPQLDGSVLEVETDGLLARAIQHETDHLNGILFIDRMSAAAKLSMKRKLAKLHGG